ncbi:hypothetical protein C2S52_020371 [Perilla frutescens var. hirtella]|nr:hypothetical protein C2S52_020371 [Perilla frutescens var. hirtella]KAH6805465.1 hypothetical protein C2S51_030296 [Perilla frutescens var. frutescens]
MASLKLLLPLLLFALSTAAQPSPPPLPTTPPPSLIDAVETLANSGYIAMAFTLQLIAPMLPLPSAAAITPLTIFSPPDASFVSSGQPSLNHLLLHFSPVSLSPAALLSFPFSTLLPSLSPFKHLIVTSNQPEKISINNVGVFRVPILDDGVVVVYAVDDFFDFNFGLTLTNPLRLNPKSALQCMKLEAISRFSDAAGVLKSRGHSIIASFLELQLLGHLDDHGGDFWTVFAPADQDLVEFSGNFLEYSSLFVRHLLPCKVGWSDLEETVNITAAIYNLKGFPLNITKDIYDEMLMVNGVEITFPDMYENEWLVIHGIKGVIALPELVEEEDDSSEEIPVQESSW